MADQIKVTGMVLSVMPVGEYDKRLVILTKEKGKIHGFARGAKRPGNSLMAPSQLFVFGEFMLIEGKNAYTVVSAKVQNYFEELRKDMDATCYGCYFLEFADYYGRENADDLEMLKLLYQTVRALCKKTIPYPLIRCIYELKIMVVNGEYPECFECVNCHSSDNLLLFSAQRRGMLCGSCQKQGGMNAVPVSPAALYTLQYIISAPVEKLYTFRVSEEVLENIKNVMFRYRNMYIERKFKSLEVLTLMENL